jgi:hypothetical protein
MGPGCLNRGARSAAQSAAALNDGYLSRGALGVLRSAAAGDEFGPASAVGRDGEGPGCSILAHLERLSIRRNIAGVSEVAGALGEGEGVEGLADGVPESLDGASGGRAQQCLELAEETAHTTRARTSLHP